MEGRAIVYCLIPAELAPRLHDLLRDHFRDEPTVEVVVERRMRERRSGMDRRAREGAPPPRTERRLVHAASGRRVGERRAAVIPVEPPELPRKARRYADRLSFVERVEPPTQRLEDLDTARAVARFQAGDHDAFAILYTRYFDRVYNYLHVVFKDPHEAEDSTQQVFMQAFEGMGSYERRGQPFRAWLFVIVRNHAIARLRKLGRLDLMEPEALNRRRRLEPAAEEEMPALDWISDPELLLFVDRLPLPQRQVLLLRFLLDLSNDEVAAVLGRTANEVRVLQHRALRFLRERLTAIGREPKSGRRPAMARCPSKARVLRERRFSLFN